MPDWYRGGRRRQAHRQPPQPPQTAQLIRPAAIDLRRLGVQGDDDVLCQSVPRPFTEQTKQCHCGDRSASAARNWRVSRPWSSGMIAPTTVSSPQYAALGGLPAFVVVLIAALATAGCSTAPDVHDPGAS